MSIELFFKSHVSVVETLEGPYVSPGNDTVTIDQLNETTRLDASSSVPVSKQAAYQVALSGGSASIDLTALEGLTPEEIVDGTGLKVQVAKFRNLATNANTITVAVGLSNGYALLGSSFTFDLTPGQSVTINLDESAPDIGSGARTIDLSGTGSQVLEVQFVMG